MKRSPLTVNKITHFFIILHMCLYVCAHALAHPGVHMEIRGQLWAVSSFFHLYVGSRDRTWVLRLPLLISMSPAHPCSFEARQSTCCTFKRLPNEHNQVWATEKDLNSKSKASLQVARQ